MDKSDPDYQMVKDHENEQKEITRFYRKNLKGKIIKDARPWLSCLDGLYSLEILFTDGTSIKFNEDGIDTSHLMMEGCTDERM